MNDKKIVKYILINELNKEDIVDLVFSMSENLRSWQQNYNDAATQIEQLSCKKQMKVIIEDSEKTLFSRMQRYINEDNDDFVE